MSSLEKELTELIARDLNIKPEEVTAQYIHDWREKHLYPRLKATLNTKLGGFNSVARRVISLEEIVAQREEAEAILLKLEADEDATPK